MFTVKVTERGEPSESLAFAQTEVTIGRVRGNDIVLRKGSVSKRHAKLLLKDGKFVAIDLKSTNGTIVNGRKIAAPQVILENDKIVIGDYVLEVFAQPQTENGRPPMPPVTSELSPPPPPERPGHTTSAAHPAAASEFGTPTPAEDAPATAASPAIVEPIGPAVLPKPAPARPIVSIDALPQTTQALGPVTIQRKHSTRAMRVPQNLYRDDAGDRSQGLRHLPPSVYAEGFSQAHQSALNAVLGSLATEDLPTTYPPSHEQRTHFQRSVKLAMPTTDGFVDSSEILDVLVNELIGLGPLEYYLDDPDIEEIHINRFDAVYVRAKGVLKPGPLAFGSAETLMAVARRVALGAHIPDPLGGAVRLPDGTRVELVMPPVSSGGPVISVVKPRMNARTSADLVAAGTASEAMLSALHTAIANGGSVLVSSPRAAHATAFVNALVTGVAQPRRIVAVENVPSLNLPLRTTVRLENVPNAQPSTLQRAAALEPDVLVVDPFGGDMVVDWLLDVAGSHCGFVATFGARNAGDAMSRLVLMALQGRASDVSSLRRQLVCSLDLLVQLREHDGKIVVGEVMELAGVDADGLQASTVFQSKIGPSGLEFYATGHVPRFFSELSAAGVEFDTSVFNT